MDVSGLGKVQGRRRWRQCGWKSCPPPPWGRHGRVFWLVLLWWPARGCISPPPPTHSLVHLYQCPFIPPSSPARSSHYTSTCPHSSHTHPFLTHSHSPLRIRASHPSPQHKNLIRYASTHPLPFSPTPLQALPLHPSLYPILVSNFSSIHPSQTTLPPYTSFSLYSLIFLPHSFVLCIYLLLLLHCIPTLPYSSYVSLLHFIHSTPTYPLHNPLYTFTVSHSYPVHPCHPLPSLATTATRKICYCVTEVLGPFTVTGWYSATLFIDIDIIVFLILWTIFFNLNWMSREREDNRIT